MKLRVGRPIGVCFKFGLKVSAPAGLASGPRCSCVSNQANQPAGRPSSLRKIQACRAVKPSNELPSRLAGQEWCVPSL